MPAPSSARTAKCPIETGPPLGLDFFLQRGLDLPLAARSKFQGDALFGTRSKPPADVIAADDEILTVIGTSTDQDMDMRIIGIPVIDRDPVEFGSEIALDIRHQLACEGSQVGHLSRILRRNDEAEVMPIFLASFSEGAFIGDVRSRIEHTGVCAIAGDAIPLQIADVFGERCRAESIAPMPDDARLDHHST